MGLTSSKDGQKCPHCQKHVPQESFTMHEIACQRRNTTCNKCGAVCLKNDMENHLKEYHVLQACPDCGEDVEKWSLKSHKSSECKERKLSCRYGCNFYASAKNMGEHESVCGSKSFRCNVCLKVLRKKEEATHVCQTSKATTFYCPLCIGEDVPLDSEVEYVRHLEGHAKKAGDGNPNMTCPICVSEGSFAIGETTPLKAHLELHKYRVDMRKKLTQWK